MKHVYAIVTALLLAVTLTVDVAAQVVTTSPAIVQTDSRNIVITFYADRGNKRLINLPETDQVYAHTGVLTKSSTSSGDWKYAPAWGNNDAKYRLTRVSTNVYTLTIPSIEQYYGIPAADVASVTQLAFVFRNANCSLEGKSDTGGDIFVQVQQPGLKLSLTNDTQEGVVSTGTAVTFTVNSTVSADLTLSVNGSQIGSQKGSTALTATYRFDSVGDFAVTATATAAGQSVTASTNIAVVAAPTQAVYPGGVPVQGAVRNEATGEITFCIAAPGKTSAIVVGSWADYNVLSSHHMNYQDYQGNRYFWVTVKGLEAGKDYMYYYLIDGSRRVGDPYARLILDPFNDKYIPSGVYPNLPVYPSDKVSGVPLAVYNSNRDVYDWKVKSFTGVDPSQLIIYELLIRDFTGTEGQANGEGTVAGVISKLDYLQRLGINAIELLPIMEFDGNNSWGYNTNFYFAPDKAYGAPDDYRRLIDECHSRGIAVILDIVFNQSAGLHPWYQMYDIAVNPFYNGSAPHSYSVLNDWNQDNPLVEQQWTDALAYWMTAYKVDGFRFDLVKGLGNNDSYGNTYNPDNNTWGTPSDTKTNDYNATRVARMSRLHAAMRAVNPNAYFINENLAGAKEENEMAADGDLNWANINTEARAFAQGTQSNSGLNRFYAPSDSRTWGTTVSYAESHDEERMAYAVSQQGVTGVKGNTKMTTRRLGSVAAQMLMCPGAHMIWQFQEFGADQTTKSGGGNNTDPKRVIWSYLDNANRAGLMQCYRELNGIRIRNPKLFREGVATTVQCGSNNWGTGRYINLVNGSSQLICAINPSVTETVYVSVPMTTSPTGYHLLSASYNTNPSILNGVVVLEPGAYAVIGTLDLAGIEQTVADGPMTTPVVTLDADRRVVITGDYRHAAVYSVDGRMYSLDTPLPRGIFIVKVDGTATKVM